MTSTPVLMRTATLLIALAMLSGCGSHERTLKLLAVKDAVQAAGLKELRITTQEGGWREVRDKGLPLTAPATVDGPDYLQSVPEPALVVVRFGRRAEAANVISVYESKQLARPTQVTRTCNVVVFNYAPDAPPERALATRIGRELRKRCA